MAKKIEGTPLEVAATQNRAVIRAIEKQADKEYSVLAPCLREYKASTGDEASPDVYLRDLTRYLLGARDETEQTIRAEMEKRHEKAPERIETAISNSMKRSAGTNYQALVSYALAKALLAANATWYVERPVPKELRESLAIVFSGGVSIDLTIAETPDAVRFEIEEALASETDTPGKSISEEDEYGADTDAAQPDNYVVQPDVDILLRDAAYVPHEGKKEALVLLSVKTSLADRAGMAARWKIYFDLVTNPCALIADPACAYAKLGIEMPGGADFHIIHGLVTANIYKINFTDARAHKGELGSGQTRSNTYMFDLKITTREDNTAETPDDWKTLSYLAGTLGGIST
jgi:hypothetical protein